MNVIERLTELMNQRGWTIYRLSQEADVPWSTINNFFRRNTEPSISTLQYLCEGMGITLAQFFDCEGELSLTAEQRTLIDKWSALNADERKIICDMVNALIKARESAQKQ